MTQNNATNTPIPVAVDHGGTGQDTAAEAFNALSPMTTLGDTVYGAASGAGTRLGGNTTTTLKFLSQTGNGSASAAPVWSVVSKTDVGLGAVENTALSSWAGTTNITTLGTIATGVWNGTAIGATFGGTGITTYAVGDTLYSSATNTLAKLSGNTTTTRKYLSQLGNGSVSAAPTWEEVEAGASVSQTEVDFGSTGVSEASFTITDAACTGTSKIILTLAGDAPTGKDADEIEMDSFFMKATPGSGSFDLYMRALEGDVADKFKVNYILGA